MLRSCSAALAALVVAMGAGGCGAAVEVSLQLLPGETEGGVVDTSDVEGLLLRVQKQDGSAEEHSFSRDPAGQTLVPVRVSPDDAAVFAVWGCPDEPCNVDDAIVRGCAVDPILQPAVEGGQALVVVFLFGLSDPAVDDCPAE